MTVLSFCFAVTSIIYFYFGFHVFYLDIRSKPGRAVHKVFFILCLVLGFWSFNHIFLVSCGSQEECWFWYRMSVPPLVFFPALILHFFLLFTAGKDSPLLRKLYFLLYIPGIIFMVKGLTGVFTIAGFVKNIYGWELIHATGTAWYNAFSVYYILMLVLSLVLTAAWYHRTGSKREKKQAKIIFITALITSFINIFLHTLLPGFKIYSVPQIAQIVILVWIFGIWYAMVRYRFLEITPAVSLNEIISNINEIVIILDAELKITGVNDKFTELIAGKSLSFKGKSISDLILFSEEINKYFDLPVKGKEKGIKCRIYYKRETESLMADSRISLLRDKFDDVAGFLVISSENKGKERLQKIYKITDPEFNIIDFCAAGLSDAEIGEKMGMASKTVETYIDNIYSRLKISSRSELISLAGKFNLILNDNAADGN